MGAATPCCMPLTKEPGPAAIPSAIHVDEAKDGAVEAALGVARVRTDLQTPEMDSEEEDFGGTHCEVVTVSIVRKSLSEELGMQLNVRNGKLIITKIAEDGVVGRFNSKAAEQHPPASQLQVGDMLIQVNNICHRAGHMVQEFTQAKAVRITVVRELPT